MACEHKSCFFCILFQLEDRESTIERPGLMAVVIQSVLAGGVLDYLLILIIRKYMHVPASLLQLFLYYYFAF